MVRTLVFHTNNVGSIPSSLSISNLLNNHSLTFANSDYCLRTKKYYVRYAFRFTSLVAPTTNVDLTLHQQNTYFTLPKRMLVRKSYLVLSWLHYLSLKGESSTKKDKLSSPRIAILPAKTHMTTVTKAPMAHKTNSKEQFLFKVYNFCFSFKFPVSLNRQSMSVNQGAYILHLTKRLFPVFETNLLFLKYYRISYPIRDITLFKHL